MMMNFERTYERLNQRQDIDLLDRNFGSEKSPCLISNWFRISVATVAGLVPHGPMMLCLCYFWCRTKAEVFISDANGM